MQSKDGEKEAAEVSCVVESWPALLHKMEDYCYIQQNLFNFMNVIFLIFLEVLKFFLSA